ncbi:MAG: arginine decarboxylase [Bacteroidetes bacterium]|nr:arginine decarboxylase [Bacteroidota bacterium]MDA0885885.1 arginine decarboxylase [Bacteroidota bacterium]MDA1226124.1 arginine decarboxylase [Bacteroidota bacterium]
MKIKYIEFIDQNFDFPQEDFSVNDNELQFHGINIMDVINKYGTPLKFTYLPQISNNIQRVKTWFSEAFKKIKYTGMYHYCYCTKSSHFKFVLDEALKNDIHLETSSSIDMDIIENLINEGKIQKSNYILCNGFKRDQYILNIANVIGKGFYNCIPIIDNYKELKLLNEQIDSNFKIGIRIASEEDPKFEFYTSRLGIGYKDIIPFYNDMVKNNSKIELKMLHFFINTGIRDTSYYWNELSKCLNVYTSLKKICPTLDSLNIGGGFPIKNSLSFDFDYKYLIEEIVNQIDLVCKTENVSPPNIFTEFGSFTVGESGASIYEVLYQKQQNDREKWNIINSSFITTLPDSWAISKRFIMLPINRWDEQYERVLLGGITCDSDDYYNSEQHMNAIYLPKFDERKPLYIGFFNTGAYQENIGGFGGLQHCLIPNPKHILIQKDSSGNINYHLFKAQQSKEEFLKILGYE